MPVFNRIIKTFGFIVRARIELRLNLNILCCSPMIVRFASFLGALLFAVTFLSRTANSAEITLYSHRHYASDDLLFAEFTRATGVRINIVKAGADELIERLKAEGSNTRADLLMTADAGRLRRAQEAGLLQPIDSDTLRARIPAHLRDPQGSWFGITQRARIVAYAKDRVKPADLSTYEDFASEKWRSRILVRSSSNIYNQSLLASIIAAHGQEKAFEWARAVRRNMARPPQGSDREQIRAVAAGLGDIAIVNTYYVGLLLNSTDARDREAGRSVGIFFPNQSDRGAHVNVSGVGLTKASKNKQSAIQFLEFLVSHEAQQTFPKVSYEYPVVEGVPWSDLQKSWGLFRADSLNLAALGELNETAVKIFNRAGWE